MLDLDHPLAQEIVERAMAILPCNVNVMDSQGLIIGSGEAERLYTRHEGAQQVVSQQRAVEIDRAAAQALRGVQEGVNLPLCLDGRLIGVIGVSGPPDSVRTFAKLVKMTAEMLLAQRSQQPPQRWMQARHERVLGALLLDGAPSPAVLAEARQLGLAPELRRTPLLLDFAEPAELAQARQWLLGQASDAWCLRVHDTRLLWCTPRAVTPALREQWAAAALKPLRVMLGSPTGEVLELQAQLRQLADLASFAEHKLPQPAWLPLASQRVAAALWRYRDDAGVRVLVEPYRALLAEDGSGQLRRTLRCWIELGGDAQACAQALSIHRNSLRYRLERIAEVCALDLASPKGMAELYLGMLLAQESAESG